MAQSLRRASTVLLVIFVLMLIMARFTANLYTDWLWFSSLNYQSVFLTILLSEVGLKIAVGVAFLLLMLLNLWPTRGSLIKAVETNRRIQEEDDIVTIYQNPWSKLVSTGPVSLIYFLISLVMAFFISTSVTGDWVLLQKYLHPSSFGVADPIFNKDVGFYVFQLPFYQFIYRLLVWSVIIVAFWAGLAYFLAQSVSGRPGGLLESVAARYHLSILASVFFVLKAWGYYLDRYNLLHSQSGVVYGPGYTDVYATLLAYKALMIISLVLAVIIIVNIFLKKFKYVLYSIGLLFVASVVLGGLYPTFMQKFIVLPDELNKEKPFIANSIKYTRLAYDLEKVEKKQFPAGRTLTVEDLQQNQDTIKNIRLWDYRPLQQTYTQLQEMRLYYELKNIDVDRYVINGEYRQVMLSPRELDQEQLPEQARTWINQRLKYTHGYGLAMSPVNEVTGEGLPQLFIKDIPPVTSTNLKIEKPGIYFGESTDGYVIVNAKTPEFDYPQGDDNAYTIYEGKKGVSINSIFRKAMFALSFGDYKLLLASDITNQSNVLYNRNIKERVPKIAPFLRFDNDPYMVVDQGGLYWLWDAYTVTNMYPYAEPFENGLNYIRNPVKVVVDAYNGDVTFYMVDGKDPIISTYSKIFPNMFKNIDQMPQGLREHIRYPEDMFNIQAQKYAVYHMEVPEVFYNKEDKWTMPTELFGKEEQNMESYYTIVKLLGEDAPEYVQILPFTPQNKKNMVAWMAGRSDGEDYGKLLVYEFPKQELVFGPMQVESRINQDTTISQQLALWDQKGSSVIRGNLLVIPVKDALLYVEPIYLQAEQSKMPELRRVIVAHGDRVVMEPTLELALKSIFGDKYTGGGQKPPLGGVPQEEVPAPAAPGEKTLTQITQEANQYFDEAQTRLKEGNWSGYGESLAKLKAALEELNLRTQ